MKKLIVLLTVIILTTGISYASRYPKYDAELSKIRTIKNAQTKVINKQIETIVLNLETLETSTTMSIAEKNQKRKEYNDELSRLTTRKVQINEKYKADKQKLKTLYKH